MVDLRAEEVVTLREAVDLLPGRPHLSTVYRWAMRGCRGGIRLRIAVVGGRTVTSRQAIQEFADRLTADRLADVDTGEPAPSRRNKLREAEAELDAVGIG